MSDERLEKMAQHMAWLKAHREEFAGQYVALDGDRLVGVGATIREAHEQARLQGVESPFITHISSVNDAPFGGW
jgi:predicted membrane GTPase involved in stress response